MTNLLETMKTATTNAATLLRHAAQGFAATLATGFEPGAAHLVGAPAGSGAHASSLDEDLCLLLQEIQRRRGRA